MGKKERRKEMIYEPVSLEELVVKVARKVEKKEVLRDLNEGKKVWKVVGTKAAVYRKLGELGYGVNDVGKISACVFGEGVRYQAVRGELVGKVVGGKKGVKEMMMEKDEEVNELKKRLKELEVAMMKKE